MLPHGDYLQSKTTVLTVKILAAWYIYRFAFGNWLNEPSGNYSDNLPMRTAQVNKTNETVNDLHLSTEH